MSEDQITRIYTALGNPYRRKIVELLRNKGRMGFKELHDTLQISVGALYHHLEMLQDLISQDAEKKYLLTERGRSAVDTLSVSEERIASQPATQSPSQESKLAIAANEFLFGRRLFDYLNN